MGGAAREGLVYAQGRWTWGNPALLGPGSHGMWMASTVFDGARYFDGMAPDLDRHCARAVNSARVMGLDPMLTGEEITDLAWEGIGRFEPGTPLYISPMFWADAGFITPDPGSTNFCLFIFEASMPAPDGFSAGLTKFRRPARDMAPTEAKASCLYPNVARCLRDVQDRGFETALVLDPSGNVAEFAYTNLFFAKDGQVHTPEANGTFLNGLTRQRVISLLRDSGVDVVERAVTYEEVLDADEVFATGNYFKVGPCTRLEERVLQPGPLFRKARTLYWNYARDSL
ncbi:MAG: branched-chain amino acid aminotransferase [Rhodospirillaceae bacterium]